MRGAARAGEGARERPVPGAAAEVDRLAESRRLLCRRYQGRTGVRRASRMPCKTPHRPGSIHHIGCRTPRSSVLVGVHPISVARCPMSGQPGWCGSHCWYECHDHRVGLASPNARVRMPRRPDIRRGCRTPRSRRPVLGCSRSGRRRSRLMAGRRRRCRCRLQHPSHRRRGYPR